MRGMHLCVFYKMLKHQPITVIMNPAQCLFILEVTGLLHSLQIPFLSNEFILPLRDVETFRQPSSRRFHHYLDETITPALCVACQVYEILSSIKSKRRKFICFGNYDFISSCLNSSGVKCAVYVREGKRSVFLEKQGKNVLIKCEQKEVK